MLHIYPNSLASGGAPFKFLLLEKPICARFIYFSWLLPCFPCLMERLQYFWLHNMDSLLLFFFFLELPGFCLIVYRETNKHTHMGKRVLDFFLSPIPPHGYFNLSRQWLLTINIATLRIMVSLCVMIVGCYQCILCI